MARVLLAEDDAAMREMARHALSGDGHTVTAAQDGLEAAEILATPGNSFDVLLTDIDMPGIDGLALTQKALSIAPGLRVVLMTAFSDVVQIPDAARAKITTVLTKPIALDQLRAAVRAAVG